MSEHPTQGVRREGPTQRFARLVVRRRAWFGSGLIALTLFFFYPILNAITTGFGLPLPGPLIRVDTNARDLFPDHPFIHAQDKFAGKFGSSSLVAIGVVVKDGTIFTPETLAKIDHITRRLDGIGYDSRTEEREALREKLEESESLSPLQLLRKLDQTYPPYPVNHDQIKGVAHRSTRVVSIDPDGGIQSDVLMKKLPKTQAEADQVRDVVRQNPPYIYGRLTSWDEKGALITADFVTDRLSSREVYMAVFDHIQKIKAEEEDANHVISITGGPVMTGWIIKHAYEIGMYVTATVLMTFALLWAYFRRWHGVLIPFVAALCTVIWGLGYCGWRGITFDPLILVIPMVITARATSHTVQMAERFFEDYEIALPRIGDPEQAKIEVASVAMGELIVPGTLGIVTDVAGLLVIMLTTIPQMYNLGEFGSFWVISIIATVEFLHPIMICYLPAPTEHEHFLPGFMVRWVRFVGNTATHPVYKYVVAGVTIFLLVSSTYITFTMSQIGEAQPGTPLLSQDHEFNKATAAVAEKFGGVDSIVFYANGDRDNASADPAPVRAMEEFERFMITNTATGTSVSLVPFLRGSWRQNHYGDPKWNFIPDHPGTLRAMVFQLQTNGPPGFLRPYMTDDGRDANIAFFYPDHKGDTLMESVIAAKTFIQRHPLGEVNVRLDENHGGAGEPFYDREKLLDVWYYALGPMLPYRGHTLNISVRDKQGKYARVEVQEGDGDLPEWIDEFREGALQDYQDTRDSLDEGEVFTWPPTLAEWGNGDVDYWWESEEFGIRAVAVNTKDLIVHDLKAVEGVPKYQPTNSWTRGVQFVMAGGVMGILAAINDEVERSHIANISLILFVIFVLHSITYQSIGSGFIIFLQLTTATVLSLAYMAVRGIGLNINTLPVQSVGVGIGVDYAIYIVDRIRHEMVDTQDLEEAVRRAVRTTGMAVTFTATTIVGGIILWVFSNLRYQSDMAQLLSILMVINMLGAITVVPAFYAILRPRTAAALLTDEQREALKIQKARERKLGLRDD